MYSNNNLSELEQVINHKYLPQAKFIIQCTSHFPNVLSYADQNVSTVCLKSSTQDALFHFGTKPVPFFYSLLKNISQKNNMSICHDYIQIVVPCSVYFISFENFVLYKPDRTKCFIFTVPQALWECFNGLNTLYNIEKL